MNNFDSQYIDSIKRVLLEGSPHCDRTNVGTLRVWGHTFNINLKEGFPINTCRKINFLNVVAELLWWIKGSTNVKDLELIYPPCLKWWQPWADKNGDLGPMYGRQYTNFNGENLNQFDRLIEEIKSNPNSRRLLLTTYNPLEADKGSLYPCHGIHTQFMVDEGVLNCYTSQRSCDLLLGLSGNIPSYSLLTFILAQCCNLKVGNLVYNIADLHLYSNHINGAKEIISRQEKGEIFNLPSLEIDNSAKSIYDFNMDSFKLINYKSGGVIKLPIAV